MGRNHWGAVVAAAIIGAVNFAWAEPPPASPSTAPGAAPAVDTGEDDDGDDGEVAADPAGTGAPLFNWQPGPAKIPLGHDLSLQLPEADAFLAGKEAGKLLEKMGSFWNDDVLGVVVSREDKADWFVIISYTEEGYVKDDEKIDADEILKGMREGVVEQNKVRVEKGFPALKLDGWAEAPRYEKAAHHLVWGLLVSSTNGPSVNYNTRVLGRRGFVSLNLVTGPERLAGDKPAVTALLAGTTFDGGARYEDFKQGTDKVAEYGIAALVAGGAGAAALKLVKIGLLAKFGKVILAALIAGKKAIVLLFVGLYAGVKRLFGGKDKAAPVAPVTEAAPPATVGAAAAPPAAEAAAGGTDEPPPGSNDPPPAA